MTIQEVHLATGISGTTIRRHIAQGWLEAERDTNGRWDISCAECYAWAQSCWDSGKCTMYPPKWIYEYLLEFHDPIARRNRARRKKDIFAR